MYNISLHFKPYTILSGNPQSINLHKDLKAMFYLSIILCINLNFNNCSWNIKKKAQSIYQTFDVVMSPWRYFKLLPNASNALQHFPHLRWFQTWKRVYSLKNPPSETVGLPEYNPPLYLFTIIFTICKLQKPIQ